MKEIPPPFANKTAIQSSETACVTAKQVEYLLDLEARLLEFSNRNASDTFSGLASALEYPGTRRYSLNVLMVWVELIAILHSSLSIYENQIVS